MTWGYKVGAYWYDFPNATSNHKPESVEALKVPPILDMTLSASARPANLTPESAGAATRILNAVDTKMTNIISRSERNVLMPQNLMELKRKGSWSFDNHVRFKGSQVGDVVEMRIPASSPVERGWYCMRQGVMSFGIIHFAVNGKPAGSDKNLYASKPEPSGEIVLGTFDPVESVYMLRIEVVVKNPYSKGTFFDLDCVVIEPFKK